MLKKRIEKALKKERGMRLSMFEVQSLAAHLGLGVWRGSKQAAKRKKIVKPEKRDPIKVHIRWMIRRDMPEVLAIEKDGFEFPRQEKDFIRCLQQRNCIGMVAEHDEKVVGFMVYELHKDQLHVLDFAVASGRRLSTVGTQMIDKLIGKLSSKGRNRIVLEVRETNLSAQMFFRSQGFTAIEVLRNYYDETTEDGIVFNYGYVPETEQKSKPGVANVVEFGSDDDVDDDDDDDGDVAIEIK